MTPLSRRQFLTATGAPFVRQPERRPNIVFLYSDDQGAWAAGRAGNRDAFTPHLDRLAREGAWFENSFVTTPVCSPSRASLMTGRYALEVGIPDYLSPEANANDGLDRRFPTWPAALRQAGYRTGLVGKWHLGYRPEFHPTNYGFEYFAGLPGGGSSPMNPRIEVEGVMKQYDGPAPDVFTDLGLDFIHRHRGEPFLLCLHYREPHASNAPDAGPKRTWLPVPEEDWARFRDLDPAIPNPRYDNLDVGEVKRMMREYLASVAALDRNAGRVVARLGELGLSRDTIVVFTSDNGMNMGHNGIWHKGNGRWILTNKRGDRPNLYDRSLRVPAILRFPARVKGGTVVRRTISNLDWFPTLLSLTGTPMPSGAVVRGRDLTPLVTGRRAAWDDVLYAEYDLRMEGNPRLRAWRTPEWKLVRDIGRSGFNELYQLSRDPDESRNLIHSTDPLTVKVRQRLDRQLTAKMKELGTGA